MFVYWIVGAFFNDLEALTRVVGIVRSFESLGSALAFGIGAAKFAPMVNLVVAFIMFCITIPATTWAVLLVPEHPESSRLAEDMSADDEKENSGKVVDAVVTERSQH